MSQLITASFWKQTLERAVKTSAQAVVALIGAEVVIDGLALNYSEIGGIALGAALLSLVSSIASSSVGDADSPSVV
jgi:hypothetical protein